MQAPGIFGAMVSGTPMAANASLEPAVRPDMPCKRNPQADSGESRNSTNVFTGPTEPLSLEPRMRVVGDETTLPRLAFGRPSGTGGQSQPYFEDERVSPCLAAERQQRIDQNGNSPGLCAP
jgi:hypothetical protein